MLAQNKTPEIYNNSLNMTQNENQGEIKTEAHESAFFGSSSYNGNKLTKLPTMEGFRNKDANTFRMLPNETSTFSLPQEANQISTIQDFEGVSSDFKGNIQRAEREFVPTDKKDSMYWSKRIKNNNSARRSRMKRRTSEQDVVEKLKTLQQENIELKYELRSLNRIFAKQLDASNIPELVISECDRVSLNGEYLNRKYETVPPNKEYSNKKYETVPLNEDHQNRKYETVSPNGEYANIKYETASLITNRKYESVSPNLNLSDIASSDLQTSTWNTQTQRPVGKAITDYTPRQNVFPKNNVEAAHASYTENRSHDLERVSNDQLNGNSHNPYGMTCFQAGDAKSASLTGFYTECSSDRPVVSNNQRSVMACHEQANGPIVVDVFSLQDGAESNDSFSNSLDYKQGIQSVPHKYRHKRGFHSAFSVQ